MFAVGPKDESKTKKNSIQFESVEKKTKSME